MLNNYDILLAFPLGRIAIQLEGGAVAALDFLPPGSEHWPTDAAAIHVVATMHAYFNDPQSSCVLPLVYQGTRFQCRVWETLLKIPVGQVVTYGDLAQQLQTSARAVGGACKANPIPILIPCHRVVAKMGLGGYSGAENFPELKRWLLIHEGCQKISSMNP